MHKPGYATSEFWLTLLISVPAFLVGAGVIPSADKQMLTDAVSKLVSGIIAAVTIYKYIASRTQVKGALYDNLGFGSLPPVQTTVSEVAKVGSLPIKALIILAIGLFATAPAYAQAQTQVGLLCFGRGRGDSNSSALLQQISAQNAQILAQNQAIMAMLSNHQSQPQQSQPPLIVFAPQAQGGPLQQIPLGGPPLQNIPLGGPPLQNIPLGGPPKQDIPLGGPPHQLVPIGAPPLQNIPLGETQPNLPQQTNPPPLANPKEAPAPPVPLVPPAVPQSIPLGPKPGGTTGYQRYTANGSYRSALWPSSSSTASTLEQEQRRIWQAATARVKESVR